MNDKKTNIANQTAEIIDLSETSDLDSLDTANKLKNKSDVLESSDKSSSQKNNLANQIISNETTQNQNNLENKKTDSLLSDQFPASLTNKVNLQGEELSKFKKSLQKKDDTKEIIDLSSDDKIEPKKEINPNKYFFKRLNQLKLLIARQKTFWSHYWSNLKTKKSKTKPVSIENKTLAEASAVPLETSTKEHSKFVRFLLFFRAPFIAIASLGLITGIVYPIVVTVIGQTVFPSQANGSQLKVTVKNPDGSTSEMNFGSELLGQQFVSPQYLTGRINLGTASNIAVNSSEFQKIVDQRVKQIQQTYDATQITPPTQEQIPVELLTASGSGLDPNISVSAAEFQIDRIVAYRNSATYVNSPAFKNSPANKVAATDRKPLTADELKAIISRFSDGRLLGVAGEPVVNVLKVNLTLDGYDVL
ncbi:potassium-transporting ATPase subunit C [[Mycoplasma] testudinis]|uniref:potassium-transporting ATPase subunit C n=1 Tax=[Mycoplasma] testudinis TaxID=33924 RepID=UPI0004877E3B|nr:potassium-transporting ATPase subunit C [[Mycoplasma] testudinis]